MYTLLGIGVSNAVVAAVLGVVVAGIGRVCRRPLVVYYLWVLVLLKLVTPPVLRIPVVFPVAAEPATEWAVPAPLEIDDAPPLDVREPEFPLSGEEPPYERAWAASPVPAAGGDPRPSGDPASQVATSVPSARPVTSWGPVFVFVWLAGSVAWFVFVAMRIWRFQRLLKHARPAPEELSRQGRRIAQRLRLRRRFEIRVVNARISPVLWAMGRRPTVLLPADLLRRLDTQQQATLLAHELAHLRRGDHWIRWLELISVGLYWWHPVVWWARHQLQHVEEQCCDAWVVWALPNQARTYARALLKTLDFLCESRPAVPPVASGFARVHFFQRRFTMILHDRLSHRLPWSRRLALGLVWLAVLPLSLHATSGGAADQEAAPAAQIGSAEASKVATEGPPVSASVLSSAGKTKYAVPKQNLQIPDNLKGCAENLRKIHAALGKYEKEKGSVPDWLSDLVPDYLSTETLFCPDDPGHRSSYWPDPNKPCSYCWELSPTELRSRPPLDKTMRDYKVSQRRVLGDVVPIVRCFHHNRVLNLAWDGQIYTSAEWFENLFAPAYRHSMLLAEGKAEAPTVVQRAKAPEVAEEDQAEVLASDDFDGKLHLEWAIVHADASHYSLEKKSGALTITTQAGSFSKSHQSDYKNLFLIDCPKAKGKDLRLTTCISSFVPKEHWNQAGLIFWKDEDNYIKCCYQTWYGRRVIAVVTETNGSMENALHQLVDARPGKIWLRLTKRGNVYQLASSLDGKSFETHGAARWGDGSIEKVGILALNGSHHVRPELDAAFELFEVAAVPAIAPETVPLKGEAFPQSPSWGALPAAPRSSQPSGGGKKVAIPEANLQIPDQLKPCAERLRKIDAALKAYEKQKQKMPDWLSDLVPDYLGKEMLVWPADGPQTTRLAPDPKLPCSFGYQYSSAAPLAGGATYRQLKDEQRGLCGDVVPLVRYYADDQCLNLSFDGRIWVSGLVWEFELDPQGERLAQTAFVHPVPGSAELPATSAERKVDYQADLEAFLREIDRTYPFFELKGIRDEWQATSKQLRTEVKDCQSDEALLGLVMEGIRSLRDAHVGFRQLNAKFPQRPPRYCPGISFMPATEERVVLMTDRTDLDADLKTGTLVTKIDGQDARRFLEQRAKAAWAEGGGFSSPQRARLFEFRIPLRGETKGEKHTITILAGKTERPVELASNSQARGWPHGYNRPENLVQVGRSCWYTRLPSGVGYIYLRYVDSSTGPGIKEALSTHPDAKGWIIDLRGNGGGGYDQALYEILRALPRPLAVIVDAGCISAGETLARDLVRYANARLFGSTTAGASSAKRSWSFPSGIATLSLPTRSRWGITGRPIEFNGIPPDQCVEAVPEEVQHGLNSAIVRAEEFLGEASSLRELSAAEAK